MERQSGIGMTGRMSMALSLRHWVFLLIMATLYPCPIFAQGRSIEVLITVVKDRVVALPGGGSPVEEPLGVNETVLTTSAHGPAGFAQTTRRLLGFSSALHRWTEIHLGVEEHVEQYRVFPRVLLVQTNRQVYGFQESRGHWFSEALGPNESVHELQGRGHVAVAITPERALAFSAFTGGFYSIRFSPNEHVQSIDQTHDAMVVRTTIRQLAFRSQIGIWTEMR